MKYIPQNSWRAFSNDWAAPVPELGRDRVRDQPLNRLGYPSSPLTPSPAPESGARGAETINAATVSRVALRGGFTLLEMSIVLVILSIIAVAAQLRFATALAEHRAATLTRQIVKHIELVRQSARATSTAKSLTINAVNQTYTLNGVTNPDRRSATFAVSLTNYVPRAAFGTVSLGGDSTLVFNGFGQPDSGGSIQVIVDGLTRAITIDSVSGNVTAP